MSITPAPWKIKGQDILAPDEYICTWSGRSDNARLIASAPELLAALEEIVKREGAFSRDQLTHAGNVIENMATIAEEAIKRVKGE